MGVMRTYLRSAEITAVTDQVGAFGQHGDHGLIAHGAVEGEGGLFRPPSAPPAARDNARAPSTDGSTEASSCWARICRFNASWPPTTLATCCSLERLLPPSVGELERHHRFVLVQRDLLPHVDRVGGAIVGHHFHVDLSGGNVAPHAADQHPVLAVESLRADIDFAVSAEAVASRLGDRVAQQHAARGGARAAQRTHRAAGLLDQQIHVGLAGPRDNRHAIAGHGLHPRRPRTGRLPWSVSPPGAYRAPPWPRPCRPARRRPAPSATLG